MILEDANFIIEKLPRERINVYPGFSKIIKDLSDNVNQYIERGKYTSADVLFDLCIGRFNELECGIASHDPRELKKLIKKGHTDLEELKKMLK